MKHTTVIAAVLLWSTLSFADGGSSPGNPGPSGPPQAPSPIVETLKGFLSDHQGITIQVASNGCTDKNSFEIYILESYPLQIQVVRKSEDKCRAYVPYGTKIKYTYDELGLNSPNSFYLSNSVESGLLPKK